MRYAIWSTGRSSRSALRRFGGSSGIKRNFQQLGDRETRNRGTISLFSSSLPLTVSRGHAPAAQVLPVRKPRALRAVDKSVTPCFLAVRSLNTVRSMFRWTPSGSGPRAFVSLLRHLPSAALRREQRPTPVTRCRCWLCSVTKEVTKRARLFADC